MDKFNDEYNQTILDDMQIMNQNKADSTKNTQVISSDGEVIMSDQSDIPPVYKDPVSNTQFKPIEQPMTQSPLALTSRQQQSLIARMGARYGVKGDKLVEALKQTCFKSYNSNEITDQQLLTILVVAEQYNLNPFTNEIYAYPKNDGVVPVIGVDGWIKIINAHPMYGGMEFKYSETEEIASTTKKCNEWIECVIHRKDLKIPIVVREYLDEAYIPPRKSKGGSVYNGPWQTHPRRMLRHKAIIQAARLAFGFRAASEDDEAEFEREHTIIDLGGIETAYKQLDSSPKQNTQLQEQQDTDGISFKAKQLLPQLIERLNSGYGNVPALVAFAKTRLTYPRDLEFIEDGLKTSQELNDLNSTQHH